MNEQRGRKSGQDLQRIGELRNQSFSEAYDSHDVGTAQIRDRIGEHGLVVFNHGDDLRDEDDTYSGTGIDLGVQNREQQFRQQSEPETCGWVEVKTKSSQEWMGRINASDYQEYRGFATYVGEPVWLYFAHVTDVETATIEDSWFVKIPPMGEDDVAERLPFKSKGHHLVEIDESHSVGWPTVLESFFSTLAE